MSAGAQFHIAVEESGGGTDHFGKPMSVYVARIKGPGDRFALDRSFLRQKPEDGEIVLPIKDGVYEVRDWPGGEKRLRYYHVSGGGAVHRLMVDDDEDVLEATSRAAVGTPLDDMWLDAAQSPVGGATMVDALAALDAAAESLAAALEGGGLDREDVDMEIDRVRRVLEAMS